MDFELNRLIKGKCLDVLRTLPDNFFDSCVSDVPYGLGKKEPKPAEILAYLQGEELDTGGDFMSRRWSIPSVNVWKEVYRVLKPGAYVLSFGGTRTFDLISMGLRFAGFINRDTIADNHPGIQWLYGCLTPDVEVLTPEGWVNYCQLSEGSSILTFEPKDGSYGWGPVQKVHVYPFNGFMVQVQQEDGACYQVTPNHTVYHAGPSGWEGSAAEQLHEEKVPSVEDLPGLLRALSSPNIQASPQEDLFQEVCLHAGVSFTQEESQGLSRQDSFNMPRVQEAILPFKGLGQESQIELLFQTMQWSGTGKGVGTPWAQRPGRVDRGVPGKLSSEDDGPWQPCLERGCHVSPSSWELRAGAICEVSRGFSPHGSQGWVHLRASPDRGSSYGSPLDPRRGGSPYGSQFQEQLIGKPFPIPESERPQKVRSQRGTSSCMARFSRENWYQGTVWCVTVPSGAFVARTPDGHVFVTGNSGMPKSSNLSMVIDKRLGHKFDSKTYSPISEAAKAVAHLGSGLKPSWEPILVFRKPFKGALVDNVQKHGTGAINIKGTRVAHSSEKDFEDHRKQVEAVRNKGGVRGNSWKNSSDLSGARPVDEGGRWPANMVMTHHPKCELHGEAPDKLSTGGAGNLLSHIRDGDPETATPSGDKTYGTSTRPVWRCHPECPIHLLDEQSGDRPSTLTGRADPNKSHAHPGTEFNPNSTFLGERTHHSNVYADSGGASRYFKQFMQELIVPFLYTTKANRKKAGCGEFEVEHPTLKSLALMQYLVRLVTPKGGIVLDPYCGSGTTCHAALLEECSYIGIELGAEGEYEEAVRRLEVVCRQIEEVGMEEDVMEYLLSGEYNVDVGL